MEPQPIQWTQHYVGTKIIVSQYAYTEKRTWRAVAVVVDQRRPNRVKPIYKRKLFIERKPTAYEVKGVGLIIHPDLYNRLREYMAQSIMKQERQMWLSFFGASVEETSAFTREDYDHLKQRIL